jgi:Na+-translocating ferredoxin:NAD+ oxidoreductase RnfD subunit
MRMKKNGLFGELIGEVFGTFILILLGDGVVANVGLAPRLAAGGYNWNTITIGWAMAVIIAVYVSGGVSGAHLNPAVTLAMAVKAPSLALSASILSTLTASKLPACPTYGLPGLVPSLARRSGELELPHQLALTPC